MVVAEVEIAVHHVLMIVEIILAELRGGVTDLMAVEEEMDRVGIAEEAAELEDVMVIGIRIVEAIDRSLLQLLLLKSLLLQRRRNLVFPLLLRMPQFQREHGDQEDNRLLPQLRHQSHRQPPLCQNRRIQHLL